jgi:hypothetical protein
MKHENRYALGKWMKRWIYLWVILGMLALILTAFIPTMLKARAASGDWTTYMADNGRSGYNPTETVINPSTAPLLKLKWIHTTAGTISTQPVEANNLIYWGSWDAGNEHATSLTNAHVWTNQLGTTTDLSKYLTVISGLPQPFSRPVQVPQWWAWRTKMANSMRLNGMQ